MWRLFLAVWQTHVGNDGYEYGADSTRIDHDLAQDWLLKPDPPPDPEWEEIDPIKRVRVTAIPHLNIRSKRDGTDLGNLMPKSVVPITKTDGDWGPVEGWIHLGYTKDE